MLHKRLSRQGRGHPFRVIVGTVGKCGPVWRGAGYNGHVLYSYYAHFVRALCTGAQSSPINQQPWGRAGPSDQLGRRGRVQLEGRAVPGRHETTGDMRPHQRSVLTLPVQASFQTIQQKL